MFRNQYDQSYFENPLHRIPLNSPRYRSRLKEILSYHKSGRLLEVGCGRGGFLRLARRSFDVQGMDVSSYAVRSLAPEFGSRVFEGDIQRAQIGQDQFHVVAAFNVLEHLPHPEQAIRRVIRSLKPGGLFLGSMPNNQPGIGKIYTLMTNLFDRTHCSTYPAFRWEGLFHRAGFRQVHLFGEVVCGSRCAYLRGPLWPVLSFNLMFACLK